MKNRFRAFCGIAMILLLGTSSISALAQNPQQEREKRVMSESDRILLEQQAGAAPATHPRIFFERQAMQGPGPGDYVFLATEMSFGGPLVKGAPYSAQAVTESTQTLIDGNRIVNRSTASIYRDSEGRTRREQTLKSIGPYTHGGEAAQTVYISDPVAGTSYTLDPKTQVARKMPPLRFKVMQGSASKDAQASSKQYQIAIEQMNAKHAAADHAAAAATEHAGASGATFQMRRKQTESGLAMGWVDARNPSARTESLGKQSIEGVEAEGTRNTVTIAAGEIGNERPIEIVNERWYSPELQILVMTRHSDPRFGENTYKLINIVRAEPARELFEVPAGYTVKEMAGGSGVGAGAGGGTGVGAGGVYSGPLNGGVLNGKAITLPKPAYPAIAKQAHASGSVTVQITIDEEGNVVAANAVSGHPLLRGSALEAARQAKFSPTKLNGEAVKVSGMLVYNFMAQ